MRGSVAVAGGVLALAGLGGAGLAGAGCRREREAALRTWAKPSPAPAPSPAFAELVAIGREAEAGAPGLLGRTQFFPGHRKTAGRVCGPLLARLARAQAGPLAFAYAPVGIDLGGPGRRGWRLLGREASWEIGDALAAGDAARAIGRYGVATRLGFDLTGGGAADASLGLAIADEARRGVVPGLARMDAGSLDALADAAEGALLRRPPLAGMVANEAANRRLLLQRLQDAWAAGRLVEEARAYGPAVADDAGRLASGSRREAAAYFAGVGEEIEGMERELAKDTTLAAPNRTWEPGKAPPRGRALRRAVTLGIEPILKMNDATLARTRLLVAECRLRARAKRGLALPRSLGEIAGGAGELEDPFSGYGLVYRRDGKEWAVYSVGADGKDDGGESDASGLAPDLRLERG